MNRFLWRTLTIAAAVSAALFVICAVTVVYHLFSQPLWLNIYLSVPLRASRPFIIYSILPAAWIIIRRRRRQKEKSRGFELLPQSEHERAPDKRND
jgi:predicted membrane protein